MAIATFYNDKMYVRENLESSPGLWKAKQLVNMIEGDPVCALRTDFDKISIAELKTVHSSEYVEGVITQHIKNGHGNKRADVLDVILWQNGSFLAATKHAVKHNTIAFSPTSGFHHAGIEYGGGFCTFNGLMIAAKWAAEQGKSVLIIDGDVHYGDGCVDILPLMENVKYVTVAKKHDPYYLKSVIEELDKLNGLVLYQAGADCHTDDSYGSGIYSTEAMIDRDSMIFGICKDNNLPVVWNLAGGYGSPTMKDTIRLHHNTWNVARNLMA